MKKLLAFTIGVGLASYVVYKNREAIQKKIPPEFAEWTKDTYENQVRPLVEKTVEQAKILGEQAGPVVQQAYDQVKPVVQQAYQQAKPVVQQSVHQAYDQVKPVVKQTVRNVKSTAKKPTPKK